MAIAVKTQAMASGNHQGAPATFNKGVPLNIRETPGPAQWTQACKNQQWCIYGIMHHYAPFSLSNSMVKLLGVYYAISNQVPKAITISKEGFSSSLLKFMAATGRPL
ncbi:hypothetical protein O181_022052 [Austropuccinia psidii MF-1]|uniref:Uncharacterized protein n=1 Tax=Austropuccinia psidii MF-1 TaxID=1389203 RepID=A0A9Q3GWS6_9BASI|nr:hypothetical protein [Austropuccinia psidii MF-1]